MNKEGLARIRQHLPESVRRWIVEFRYRFLKKTGYGEDLIRWKKFRVYHRRYDQDVNDPMLYLTLDVEKGETSSFLQMLDALKEKGVCRAVLGWRGIG